MAELTLEAIRAALPEGVTARELVAKGTHRRVILEHGARGLSAQWEAGQGSPEDILAMVVTKVERWLAFRSGA